ncbi:hypothetical protein BDZ91DRAFT_769124 [Kalaharituber pfeilii]|nr:hypothetical protein BDZ91DRAFT_769124 [Kalaharituber pfeilii]
MHSLVTRNLWVFLNGVSIISAFLLLLYDRQVYHFLKYLIIINSLDKYVAYERTFDNSKRHLWYKWEGMPIQYYTFVESSFSLYVNIIVSVPAIGLKYLILPVVLYYWAIGYFSTSIIK